MHNLIRDIPLIIAARRHTRRKKKPLIGLAVSDAWPDRLQVRRLPYDFALARAGARIRTLVPGQIDETEMVLEQIDGLVCAGGEDIDPRHYAYEGTKPHVRSSHVLRDRFELALLDGAIAAHMPVLCICRGAQLLAVWGGGGLQSHVNDEMHTREHISFIYRLAYHPVTIVPQTRLAGIIGKDRIRVNSFHHQSIRDPGNLRVCATAQTGQIEAVEIPGEDFILGVQWHPEVMALCNRSEQRLFRAFIDAARRYKEQKNR